MGFTAFIWLLKVDRASRVATHTFREPHRRHHPSAGPSATRSHLPMLAAGGVIIFSVALISGITEGE